MGYTHTPQLEKKMTKLENTKPQSVETDSISDAMRCHHRRPSGRRCKLAVTAPGAPFCFTHTQEFNKADSLNLKTALLTNHEGFQTAQGINHSLRNLYILLANNYISPRRAAVLAYITNQLLRTVTVIQHESAQAAEVEGIDMTGAPRPIRNLPKQDVVRPYAPDQYQYSQFLASRRREP